MKRKLNRWSLYGARILTATAFTTLMLTVVCTGCVRNTESEMPYGGKVEVTFSSAVASAATRIGEGNSPLEQGTAFRVVVYKENDNPERVPPVATGVYTIIDNAGTASALTLDDRILLYTGTYDFYFIAPAAEPSAGIVAVKNGDEVLTTDKQTCTVKPDSDGKFAIVAAFKRCSAMLDVVVYCKDDDPITTSVTVPSGKTASITGLLSSGNVLIGNTSFTSTGNTGMGTIAGDRFMPETDAANGNTKSVSTFTNGVHRGLHVLPGTTDLAVAVPVILNENPGRIIQAQVSGVKFEEGKYYTLKLQVSLTTPVMATIKEWIPSGGNGDEIMGFTDYTNQPGNCYITQPGAAFWFDATKKPRGIGKTTAGCNPSTATDDQQASTDLNPSDIKEVKIVWQTAINHSSPASGATADMVLQQVSYDAATGICLVIPHATGCGNALIAAYSDTDAKNILWCWHIWVTEGKVQSVGTATSVNGGGKFMDRNLGALATTNEKPQTDDAYKYFGLLYQHSRPTPITGQGIGNTRSYTAIYSNDGTLISESGFGEYTQSQMPVSASTAIQNPTLYYDKWYTDDTSLWSDYDVEKSIYDPCPYGYRVPTNGSWSAWTKIDTYAQTVNGGAVWDGSWWPAAGYRGNSGGNSSTIGRDAYYWASTPHSTKYQSYVLYFINDATTVRTDLGYPRGDGFSVRCVEDKAVENN